jgi:hypothetical protein
MHLTDEQLNEYLDNEIQDRVQIELHLSSCDECTTRLTVLSALFLEIESLPEVTLSHDLAIPFTPQSSLPASLPRWLTLTATLQAVAAIIAVIFAAPKIAPFLAPILQTYPIPSLKDALVVLEMNFVMWMQAIQSFQYPSIPRISILPKEFSNGILSISVICIFFVWVVGNWWLLRKQYNSPS